KLTLSLLPIQKRPVSTNYLLFTYCFYIVFTSQSKDAHSLMLPCLSIISACGPTSGIWLKPLFAIHCFFNRGLIELKRTMQRTNRQLKILFIDDHRNFDL